MTIAQIALLWCVANVLTAPYSCSSVKRFISVQWAFAYIGTLGLVFYWGPILWSRWS